MDAAQQTKQPRRTLTEDQLAKKRRIDKLKHRENRAENKTRLENIERDVSFLRDTIGDLMMQLRQLNQNPPAQHQQPQQPQKHHPHPPTPHQHTISDQLICLPKSAPWNSPPGTITSSSSTTTAPLTAAPSMAQVGAAFYGPVDHHLTERLFTPHIFPEEPLEAHADMEALLAEICGQNAVECRCGKLHQSYVQCTERITVIMAVELSNVANQTSLRSMAAPRNPSLPDMLLHHTEMSGPLIIIISSILRQYEARDVESLCGIFLLAYRLLRWRYYPSAESIADVPAIMRPTQAQVTIPHPKCIDFIPFPALRSFLCLNQHKDPRHSVDLYLRSLRLILPPGKGLMTKSERGGGIELSPDFEALASDLRNWRLGPPWSDEFPQLRQFLY